MLGCRLCTAEACSCAMQVFFIDNTTGALSSKVNGHAIDVEGVQLLYRSGVYG
jgi:hypothetical protein